MGIQTATLCKLLKSVAVGSDDDAYDGAVLRAVPVAWIGHWRAALPLPVYLWATCSLAAQLCLTLWPHGLQHARLPCPSPSPGTFSNSCPLRQWCCPTLSSSVVSFFHLQSFPASGYFPMNQLFTSGAPSIGVSASASVFPMNIQDWFPLGLTGLNSLWPKGSQESSPTPHFKSINYLVLSLLYGPAITAIHEKLLETP